MNTELIGIALTAIIIQAAILSFVISTSSETKKKLWYMQKQLNILIKIAEKSGVPAAEIEEALK